jgi:hypothetical protein
VGRLDIFSETLMLARHLGQIMTTEFSPACRSLDSPGARIASLQLEQCTKVPFIATAIMSRCPHRGHWWTFSIVWMAVGTLDGHAPASLVDNEVIPACFTFEEDIGHLFTPKGGAVSV